VARVVGRLAKHLLEVEVVELEQLSDHVEDPVAERLLDVGELLEEALEDLPLDRVRRGEVEDVDVSLLADAMDAPHPLFEPVRVPRQVVVDHQVAELEVDPLACGLGGDADLGFALELDLPLAALLRAHAAVDLRRRVAPLVQLLEQVIERVLVLREDQELAATVLELCELGTVQTRLERLELRLLAGRKRLPRQLHEPRELVDLLAQPLDRLGDERLVQQLLQLRKHLGEALVPPDERARDRSERARETALEDDTSESKLGAPLSRDAREELVDVVRDLFVQLVFGVAERERLRHRVAFGEESTALEVPQVFLHAPQVPRVAFQLNHLAVPAKVDELVLVEQPQEVLELIGVPLVRSRRQEKQPLRLARKALRELVALRLRDLVAVGPGRALVRLVDD